MFFYIVKTEVEVLVRAFLAQSVERAAFNRKVVGSRPTGGVFYIWIIKSRGASTSRKKYGE